ncbi:hypothetical protein L1049_009849 [Liquidambar formosana]|uniref:Uncharacterized protein n=1 Tax=Liquidambar formosana TaxID=63359 RepID=A0AAP0N6H4_LIQFO
MVAGKVKVAMGLQKSPATPKHETPPKPPLPSPSSTKAPPKAVFSRSFGVYFPRASAQVQPRPPDVTELLRLVEELRERESRLKTEILEQKLLRESVAILPVLENEIATKDGEIEKAAKRIEGLEAENERLRIALEGMRVKMEEERRESEKKVKEMEEERRENERKVKEMEEERRESERKLREMEVERREIEKKLKEMEAEMAKTASDRRETKGLWSETGESDELSSSQRFQGLIDAAVKSNLIRNLKKGSEIDSGGEFESGESQG